MLQTFGFEENPINKIAENVNAEALYYDQRHLAAKPGNLKNVSRCCNTS
jgi:hypothetical protein